MRSRQYRGQVFGPNSNRLYYHGVLYVRFLVVVVVVVVLLGNCAALLVPKRLLVPPKSVLPEVSVLSEVSVLGEVPMLSEASVLSEASIAAPTSLLVTDTVVCGDGASRMGLFGAVIPSTELVMQLVVIPWLSGFVPVLSCSIG